MNGDKDVGKLKPPPADLVEEYFAGKSMGPSEASLVTYNFTNIPTADNAWNRAICSILAVECVRRQDTELWVLNDSPAKRMPRSEYLYWEHLVHTKWLVIYTHWRQVEPRMVKDPTENTWRKESTEPGPTGRPSERDARLLKSEENHLTASRRRTRRCQVSSPSTAQRIHVDSIPAVPKTTSYMQV
jgi:hypothetical protein